MNWETGLKQDPKVFMSEKEENSDADTPTAFKKRQ